jgi:hypothetical protein
MQVTVDQADGTNAQMANANTSISGINNLTLEGEGVSPVAVSQNDPSVGVLIAYMRNQNTLIPHPQNITIANPVYASLVLKTLDNGHIIVMFDRQPIWRNGPGSDIEVEDNRVILREVVNFLAVRPDVVTPVIPTRPGNSDARIVPIFSLLLD